MPSVPLAWLCPRAQGREPWHRQQGLDANEEPSVPMLGPTRSGLNQDASSWLLFPGLASGLAVLQALELPLVLSREKKERNSAGIYSTLHSIKGLMDPAKCSLSSLCSQCLPTAVSPELSPFILALDKISLSFPPGSKDTDMSQTRFTAKEVNIEGPWIDQAQGPGLQCNLKNEAKCPSSLPLTPVAFLA